MLRSILGLVSRTSLSLSISTCSLAHVVIRPCCLLPLLRSMGLGSELVSESLLFTTHVVRGCETLSEREGELLREENRRGLGISAQKWLNIGQIA